MIKSLSNPNILADPNILALEASGGLLSAALHKEGQIVSLISHDMTHGHAKDIVPTAMAALQQAGCDFETVTHIAAGAGPGSFTGIRVALACAKGFCLSHGAKGIGVSGLQALASDAAQQGRNESARMLITADTRRGALYCQFFDKDGQATGAIFEAKPDALPDFYANNSDISQDDAPLYIGGFDHARLADIFVAQGVRVIAPDAVMPLDAAMIAIDAKRQIMTGTLTPLTPLYLAAAKLGPPKKDPADKNKAKATPVAQG
ncbi:MAG: tRNA (adenosine(37)-N6)-threonylcarbamoyltransferase complex dimerization subunit type 1 TsaB [Candidatus Puniceispirillum sp.]